MRKVGRDPNFKTVLKLAAQQKVNNISYDLTPKQAAGLILQTNEMLIHGSDLRRISKRILQSRLNLIALYTAAEVNAKYFDNLEMRRLIKFNLLLWYGCLASAKLIAFKTRSGVNTPNLRSTRFPKLHRKALRNKTIELGIKAGYYFKRFVKQNVYFDGIPKNLAKRYYPEVVK